MGIFRQKSAAADAVKKAEADNASATDAKIAKALVEIFGSRQTFLISLLGGAVAFGGAGYYVLDRAENRIVKAVDDKFAILIKSSDDHFKAIDDRLKAQDSRLEKIDDTIAKINSTNIESARALGRIEGKLGIK